MAYHKSGTYGNHDRYESGLRLTQGQMPDVPSDILKPGPNVQRAARRERKGKKYGAFSAKDAGDAIARAAQR